MSSADQVILVNAIATKEGTAQELSDRYGYSIKFLRSFVEKHKEEIAAAHDKWKRWQDKQDNAESTSDTTPTPLELEDLWIADKTARLQKLQAIADRLYKDCMEGGFDAASLREFRSYCAAAANELGQLMHRGAGDSTSDVLNVDIQGVDFERLQ